MCLYPVDLGYAWSLKNRMPRFVPCGQCLECLCASADEWAFRIMDEASQYEDNCCITLTYANNPEVLVKSDFQNFIKVLRRFVAPRRIRYFGCGEYGRKRGRPHFHIIIFNWKPDDMKLRTKDGYLSATVSGLWKKGFIQVGDLSLETAKYCAKYLQKMDDREHAVPAFTLMSTHPGIGYGAIDPRRIKDDGNIRVLGKNYAVPRYYRKVIERESPYFFSDIHEKRFERSKLVKPNWSTLVDRRRKISLKLGRKLSEKLLTPKEKRVILCTKERERKFRELTEDFSKW